MEKIQKFKSSLSLKLFVVGFLVFILMIPTAMIAILVNERENRQSDAILEVSEKWGRKQMITGPILTVPYKKIYESMVDGNKIKYKYELNLVLNGSRDLEFVPIGRTTEVRLASTWTDPSFQGSFLPNKYNLNENGFSADWKILEINRNFPQSFLGTMTLDEGTNTAFNKYEEAIQVGGVQSSSFGVRLLVVADEYQKTVRALKYAIMILSLTFLILFFFEAINKKRVHALQYILIGLALSLFYVLLLSIAEHLGFDLAYWISVVATLGLIMFYSKSVFAAWRPAMIESLILFFIYSFIFVILQLKDYALLVGSVGLFVILAVVMYVSRKIDWYNLSEK